MAHLHNILVLNMSEGKVSKYFGKTIVLHQVNLNLNNPLMFYSRFPYLSPITKTYARKLHPDCHWSTSRSNHLCFPSQISTSDEH